MVQRSLGTVPRLYNEPTAFLRKAQSAMSHGTALPEGSFIKHLSQNQD